MLNAACPPWVCIANHGETGGGSVSAAQGVPSETFKPTAPAEGEHLAPSLGVNPGSLARGTETRVERDAVLYLWVTLKENIF